MDNNKSCSICGNKYYAKGWCCRCYYREHRKNIKIKKRIKEYMNEYNKMHKEEFKIRNKENRKKNIKKIRSHRLEYNRKCWKENVNYKICVLLRSRLKYEVKKINKNKYLSTMKLLGCSINELKIHLEKQFDNRMNWQNMGKNGWVIDHIQPCCSFDLAKEEEQKKCFHYTNLRPLWWYDNQKKASEDKKKSIRSK